MSDSYDAVRLGIAALGLVLVGAVAALGASAWSGAELPALPDSFVPPHYAIGGSAVTTGDFAVVWTQLDRAEAAPVVTPPPPPRQRSGTWRILMVNVHGEDPSRSTAILGNELLRLERVVRPGEPVVGSGGLRVRAIEILGAGDDRQAIVSLIGSHGAVRHLTLRRAP